MKHIFVINPTAGPVDSSSKVLEELKKYDGKLDYIAYITKYRGDTTRYVKEMCDTYSEPLKFYACGGDGTLNDCLNGMFDCDHASITHYPMGSGNDFIKYFPNHDDFFNLDKLIDSEERDIDILKVNDRYSINITNFGLDASVCYTMNKIRRNKLIGGKRAYSNSVIYGVLFKRKNNCTISVDGNVIHSGKMMLAACANARVYGGGYKCAPEALIDDGVFDLCLLKSIPLLTISRLLDVYKAGNHLECEELKPYVVYTRGKKLTVDAPKGIAICYDGEVEEVTHFDIELLPKACKFCVPR